MLHFVWFEGIVPFVYAQDRKFQRKLDFSKCTTCNIKVAGTVVEKSQKSFRV